MEPTQCFDRRRPDTGLEIRRPFRTRSACTPTPGQGEASQDSQPKKAWPGEYRAGEGAGRSAFRRVDGAVLEAHPSALAPLPHVTVTLQPAGRVKLSVKRPIPD